MKVLYFDCFSGISGDMTLGALLDLGVEQDKLLTGLEALNIDGYKIKVEKKLKNGIMGTSFNVELEHTHEHDQEHEEIQHHHHDEHRTYKDIEKLIDESKLNENVKLLSKKMFLIVAKAEGEIHGKPIDEVHFHEVGAVDSIVDIIGTAICIDLLKPDKIMFSKLPLSRGFVKCQHGMIPLPAPATMKILKGAPVYYNDAGFELITPTGAAIAMALCDAFGENIEDSEMQIECTGYGLGKKEYHIPNVLRAILYNVNQKSVSVKNETDTILNIETNIDDMTPEQLGFIFEKLYKLGALDVFFTSIMMKKNRPGVKLTVLCPLNIKEKIVELLLKETSTFGIRYNVMNRAILARESIALNTKYGEICCKAGKYDGKIVKLIPEYEDCKRAAQQFDATFLEVYNEISARTLDYLHSL